VSLTFAFVRAKFIKKLTNIVKRGTHFLLAT